LTLWRLSSRHLATKLNPDGTTSFISVVLDVDGHVAAKGDMRGQTRKTLENIRAVLAAMRGRMKDVVSLTH